MINDYQWIAVIDHRISAAVVFFVLMLLLNTGERRRLFPLRAALSLTGMCVCSWLIRYTADVLARSIWIQASM